MKKWILLFLVSGFANTASAAVDHRSVCNKLNIHSTYARGECYKLVKGSEYVQQGAINVCKKAEFFKVTCIVNALDKTYSAQELKLCGSELNTYSQAICMQERGEVIISHSTPSHDRLKRRLRRVKRKIKAGEHQRALRIINRILDNLA